MISVFFRSSVLPFCVAKIASLIWFVHYICLAIYLLEHSCCYVVLMLYNKFG